MGLWSEVGTSDGITVAETPVVIEEEATTLEVVPPLPTEPTTPPVPSIPLTIIPEPKTPIGQAPITTYQSPIEMAVQVYEDPEYVKLYVHLKNVGDKSFYTGLNDFTLLTKDGRTIRPDITQTYITGGHFSPGSIYADSESEGFIIFNTKGFPKTLIYKDFSGNEVSLNLP